MSTAPGRNYSDREYAKRYRTKLKREIMAAYGGCCACCGVAHLEFMTLDHLDGKGNEHRATLFKNSRFASHLFYGWLRRNGFPPGYQLLCANCHMAKSVYGGCPHAREEGLL